LLSLLQHTDDCFYRSFEQLFPEDLGDRRLVCIRLFDARIEMLGSPGSRVAVMCRRRFEIGVWLEALGRDLVAQLHIFRFFPKAAHQEHGKIRSIVRIRRNPSNLQVSDPLDAGPSALVAASRPAPLARAAANIGRKGAPAARADFPTR